MRTVESVDRALLLLLAFDEQEGGELTVAELAARLNVHRSTASRLAGTLVQRGFLERAQGAEAFRLGPALARLGLVAMRGRELIRMSREIMEELALETGEAVVLSVLDGVDCVGVAQVSGTRLVGMRNWIGRRSPLHAASDGKVFLAFADAHAGSLDGRTEATISETATLEAEIARIRDRGWASAEGELEEGLNGVAAPVWDQAERCVGALSVSGPAYRLPAPRLLQVGARVKLAADGISSRLGGGHQPLPRPPSRNVRP
jgi:DNA-binding IclR family transcriptional regulator